MRPPARSATDGDTGKWPVRLWTGRTSTLVTYCEQDAVVTYAKHGPAKNAPEITIQANTKPWGIARVNGGVGSGFKRAWVIDTGIQYHHPASTSIEAGRAASSRASRTMTETVTAPMS